LPLADLADLAPLAEHEGSFFTALLPAPSRQADAAHRFEIAWKNARRELLDPESAHWDEDDLRWVDELVSTIPHHAGEAFVVVHADGGPTHVEVLDEPVHDTAVTVGAFPRLAPLIESRQRVVSHLVVETDRTGADVTAFDGGAVIGHDTVSGDTEHIHRGHPGGWSQRRFQQRAENTWERNAGEVADAVVAMAERVAPSLVFVSGEVRAKSLVVESLPSSLDAEVVALEAGDDAGIADEVVRLIADHVATGLRVWSGRLSDALADEDAVADVDETLDALVEGRVATLLVHDDRDRAVSTQREVAGHGAGVRVVDLAVVLALRSGADVVAVPRLAAMDGPLAALLRW
jgi:predicted alpha/beta hydrolase family esterase